VLSYVLSKIASDHSSLRDISSVPYPTCHSFVSSFLCHSLQISEEDQVYLVCILYASIRIDGLICSESQAGGSEHSA